MTRRFPAYPFLDGAVRLTVQKGMAYMAETQKPVKKHTLSIDGRERLTATGILRVDTSNGELITAQTDLGQLNIKGEGLHIVTLNSETGDMLVNGKVAAVAYTENGPALSFFGRLFK